MKTNKRKRTQRQVIHPRVDMDIYKRLKAYAARTGTEDSAIANAALAQYLDKSSDTAHPTRRTAAARNRRSHRVHDDLGSDVVRPHAPAHARGSKSSPTVGHS
jgi:predicted transcriptional regulator